METQDRNNQQESIASLQEVIHQQKLEIERLQTQSKQEHFAEELRKLLTSSQVAGLVLSPFSRIHLLETIVQAATSSLNARSSSLFLINEATQELTFEVAIGPAATEVKKFRVPLGHGIAGLVALTGQPMTIANAQQDPRLATDIAFAVNYIPESILCVPLFYDDRVIGVLELLDKQTGVPFGLHDLEISGQFANIAAVAIAQSSALLDQQTFFQAMIRTFSEADVEHQQRLYREAAAFIDWANITDQLSAKAHELALYVHELILDGEQSCDLCTQILLGVVTRVRERKRLQDNLSSFCEIASGFRMVEKRIMV